jgi:hypothetical protein
METQDDLLSFTRKHGSSSEPCAANLVQRLRLARVVYDAIFSQVSPISGVEKLDIVEGYSPQLVYQDDTDNTQ